VPINVLKNYEDINNHSFRVENPHLPQRGTKRENPSEEFETFGKIILINNYHYFGSSLF